MPLVWTVTLALLAVCAGEILATGYDEESLRFVIRLTARVSLATFCAAFLASAARRTAKNAATAWLRRNRRYLGLAFASSQAIHLVAIRALTRTGVEFDAVTLGIGGLGYAFTAAMAATSNDRAVAALGRNWVRLHRAGMYYIWFVFTATYAASLPGYGVASFTVPLLLAVLAFRLWALRGRGGS